ncbi:hypothetical protein ACFLTR_01445 [Chloroflexota bacterium]
MTYAELCSKITDDHTLVDAFNLNTGFVVLDMLRKYGVPIEPKAGGFQ